MKDAIKNLVWAGEIKSEMLQVMINSRHQEALTRAHAATKAIVRAYRKGGVAHANAETPQIAGDLFATEDLQNAVASFLRDGPGHASFSGR